MLSWKSCKKCKRSESGHFSEIFRPFLSSACVGIVFQKQRIIWTRKKMANNDIPKKITVSLKKNSWRPGIKKMASKYNPPRFYSYRIQIDLVFWNNNRAMFKITDHLWLYTHYCYSYWEKETSIFKGIYDTRRLQDLSQLKIFTLWILHYCWFFTVPQVKYN